MKKYRSNKRTKRAIVDFLKNEQDFACGLWGAQGFSTKCIMAKSGLSKWQVVYRLPLAGISRAMGTSRTDFRDGKSPFAKTVIDLTQETMHHKFRQFIRRHI